MIKNIEFPNIKANVDGSASTYTLKIVCEESSEVMPPKKKTGKTAVHPSSENSICTPIGMLIPTKNYSELNRDLRAHPNSLPYLPSIDSEEITKKYEFNEENAKSTIQMLGLTKYHKTNIIPPSRIYILKQVDTYRLIYDNYSDTDYKVLKTAYSKIKPEFILLPEYIEILGDNQIIHDIIKHAFGNNSLVKDNPEGYASGAYPKGLGALALLPDESDFSFVIHQISRTISGLINAHINISKLFYETEQLDEKKCHSGYIQTRTIGDSEYKKPCSTPDTKLSTVISPGVPQDVLNALMKPQGEVKPFGTSGAELGLTGFDTDFFKPCANLPSFNTLGMPMESSSFPYCQIGTTEQPTIILPSDNLTTKKHFFGYHNNIYKINFSFTIDDASGLSGSEILAVMNKHKDEFICLAEFPYENDDDILMPCQLFNKFKTVSIEEAREKVAVWEKFNASFNKPSKSAEPDEKHLIQDYIKKSYKIISDDSFSTIPIKLSTLMETTSTSLNIINPGLKYVFASYLTELGIKKIRRSDGFYMDGIIPISEYTAISLEKMNPLDRYHKIMEERGYNDGKRNPVLPSVSEIKTI
jgi:hypothetical protein